LQPRHSNQMTHARKNWPSLVSLIAKASFAMQAGCYGPWLLRAAET
jgi:hypothetical protein